MTSIAQILQEQGRVAADTRRRSGERWGSIVSELGEIPARIVDDRQKARLQQAALQRQAVADKRAADEFDLKKSADARAAAGETRAAAEATRQNEETHRAALADGANKVRASSYDPNVAQMWLQDAAQRGLLNQDEHASLAQQAQDPEGLKRIVDFIAPAQPTPKAPEPFTLNPGDVRYGADGKPLANNPRIIEPKAEPNPTESSLAMAAANGNQSAVKALEILRRQQAAGRAPEKNPLDSQTEWAIPPGETEARLMTKSEIQRTGAKRPAGADKPSSGQQKRVLNFFNRAQQADADLEGMESQIQGQGLAGQAYSAIAPNFAQTQLGQSYTQAQRAFTEARLRKDSGAAIPEQEYANDRKTYFVQPGDSKETLEQKRRARATMLASLGFESGQALGEFLGDADEAKKVVEGYKTRSTGAGATKDASKKTADPLGIR